MSDTETKILVPDLNLDAESAVTRKGLGSLSLGSLAMRGIGLGAVTLAGVAGGLALIDLETAGPAGYLLVGGLALAGAAALAAVAAGRGRSGGLSANKASALALSALEAIPDPCAVTDWRGGVLFANQAYRQLGLDESDRPISLERLLAGDDRVSEALYQLAQAARLGLSDEAELRFQPPAGRGVRVYQVTVQPVQEQANGGGGKGALWHLRDVTGEREATDAAHREQGRFIGYLDTAPFGFFSALPSGVITYVNETLGTWLDLDPERITERGLALSDLVQGDVGALAPPVVGEGEIGQPVPEVLDVDLRGPDGIVPVRIVQSYSYDGQGTPIASRSLVLDRSPDDKVEAHLRDAEMRFARFFNTSPIGIVVLDRDLRIENVNAAFSGLVGEQVARGAEFTAIAVPDDIDALKEALAVAGGSTGTVASTDIRLVGQMDRVAHVFVSSLAGNEDDQGGIVLYLIDATEQKNLEMQFAQSQKMQAVGQLAGGVAHDFNNLLTAIIGFCDLLLARHKAGDPSFADVMQIKQNANRAANLTRQLLAFSRRQTLRPKVLALTDELAELSNLLARLLGEKVELKIVHGRDLWPVKVDQNQLEQVIINLAVNARDAMPEGGKLTIRTANVSEEDSRALDHSMMPDAEYVLIEVSDTGVGIPQENMVKIFEPFFTTKDVNKGTGLGLSTVYGIVKQTGGFVFPFSTVNKGTSFRIYLPRHVMEEGAVIEADLEAEKEVAESKKDLSGHGTILLVEDEDAVRTFAARALQSRGYDVLEAEAGDIALEVVADFDGEIDLVVSDVVMPNMDGPTMIKHLRKIRPDIKVIFVSGYAEDAFEKSLDPDQEFRFLPKPFSLKQLAGAVKEAIEEG